MNVLTQASNEWRKRPDDQRFTSLVDLDRYCAAQRARSVGSVASSRKIDFRPDESSPIDALKVDLTDGRTMDLTHWSFGQVATLAGAPAGYLRDLPAPIAADCLNYGMKYHRAIEDVGVLIENDMNGQASNLRAATGPRYGRIWNSDLTHNLVNRFGDGVTGDWRVPGEFGQAVEVTKQNTTLYASDRDMFVFLADEKNRIEMPNRRDGKAGSLARGFFVWNSEVGSQSIGAAFFLFDYACSNRMVWGAQQFKEMRLRHTVSAPDRWLEEIAPVMLEYADSSAKPIEEAIKAAQAKKLDNVAEFLSNRFGKKTASQYMAAHEREESRPIETLWDAATGMTAFAKTIKWQDERVVVEREAGKLLDMVAAA